MGSSVSLNSASISSLAEKIADARRLYGADSAYVIGVFAGLDWVLDAGDSDRLTRQLRDRVIEIESGKTTQPATPATPSKPSKQPAKPSDATPAPAAAESDLAENDWIKGSVKWFNNDKGYGFISTASDTDVFVHWRDISSWDRSLGQGDEVEFMVTKTAKGFQAINVMKKERGDGTAEPSESERGKEREPANESAAPEATSESGAAPAATSESGAAPEATSESGAAPAATSESGAAPEATSESGAAPESDAADPEPTRESGAAPPASESGSGDGPADSPEASSGSASGDVGASAQGVSAESVDGIDATSEPVGAQPQEATEASGGVAGDEAPGSDGGNESPEQPGVGNTGNAEEA